MTKSHEKKFKTYFPDPPTAAQNISCQTNLSFPNTLVCRWDPSLQETHLATRYSLHTEIGWIIRRGKNNSSKTTISRLTKVSQPCRFRDLDQNHSYELPPGVHRYNIPRADFVFFSEMKIYVRAANELGEAISEPVVLEPISAGEPHRVQLPNVPSQPLRLPFVTFWEFCEPWSNIPGWMWFIGDELVLAVSTVASLWEARFNFSTDTLTLCVFSLPKFIIEINSTQSMDILWSFL